MRRFCLSLVLVCTMGSGWGYAKEATESGGWLEQDTLTGDWGGVRTKLEERGVSLSLAYTGEVSANVTGGYRRGVVYNGLAELALDLDLEKRAGWKGATIHGLVMYPHGASGTEKLTRDIATYSGIDAYDSVRLFELWIEQNLFDGAVSLRAGQLSADEEFALSTYGDLFSNSGMAGMLIFYTNMPVPVYAIAGLGARLRVEPVPGFYAMVAAYDGNVAPGVLGDPSSDAVTSDSFNHYGTSWALRDDEGVFVIGELGFAVNQPEESETEEAPEPSGKTAMKSVREVRGLAGSYKVGFGYHSDSFADVYTATLSDLGSTLAPEVVEDREGNYAVYAVIDQELWREPDSETEGLGAFARFEWSPERRSYVDLAVESGVVYTGLIPGRPDDRTGLAVAWYRVSDEVADAVRDANRADGSVYHRPDYELVIEATHIFQITPWWTIQPDVQYIIHPGGSGEYDNALVLLLQTSIVF